MDPEPFQRNPDLIYFSHKLQAAVNLHNIMNEMALLLFGGPSGWTLTVDEIYTLKRELDGWYNILPVSQSAQSILTYAPVAGVSNRDERLIVQHSHSE